MDNSWRRISMISLSIVGSSSVGRWALLDFVLNSNSCWLRFCPTGAREGILIEDLVVISHPRNSAKRASRNCWNYFRAFTLSLLIAFCRIERLFSCTRRPLGVWAQEPPDELWSEKSMSDLLRPSCLRFWYVSCLFHLMPLPRIFWPPACFLRLSPRWDQK